jgi:hypothetical protein
VFDLFTTKSLIKKIKAEIKEEENRHDSMRSVLQNEKNTFKLLKADPVKLKFAHICSSKNDLNSRKRKLINEINEMKSYLGVN